MGGHHHPKLPEVPDWRIYRVEDVPELMQVKKALAQHGLSDPWLRNEVWKYTECQQHKFTVVGLLKRFGLRGFKYGATAGVITAAIEFAFFPIRKPYGEHAHGH